MTVYSHLRLGTNADQRFTATTLRDGSRTKPPNSFMPLSSLSGRISESVFVAGLHPNRSLLSEGLTVCDSMGFEDLISEGDRYECYRVGS
jgi:hypothetical protein